jgi:acetyltransferase-like isoleucine patch superfamily enzyme
MAQRRRRKRIPSRAAPFTRRGEPVTPQWIAKRLKEKAVDGVFYLLWWKGVAKVPFRIGHAARWLVAKAFFKHIGWNTIIFENTWVEAPWNISLGKHVWIGEGCRLVGSHPIEIGDETMVAFQTAFQPVGHEIEPGIPIRKQPLTGGPIKIGRNCWVGARSLIRHGVELGDEAVVGMGSLVLKSVPAGEVWAGSPARFLKTRDGLITRKKHQPATNVLEFR